MIYIRGNTADFDGWTDEGAPGWSYREMLPYFNQVRVQ
jgi:choline dehydrogenase